MDGKEKVVIFDNYTCMLHKVYAKLVEARNPVPINSDEADDMVERIYGYLQYWLPYNTNAPSGHMMGQERFIKAIEIARSMPHTFKITNPLDGWVYDVRVKFYKVEPYRTNVTKPDLISGGSFGFNSDGVGILSIGLRTDWAGGFNPKEAFQDERLTSMMRKELRTIVYHELTHALDKRLKRKRIQNTTNQNPEDNYENYLMQRHEVNAWGREVYQFAYDFAKGYELEPDEDIRDVRREAWWALTNGASLENHSTHGMSRAISYWRKHPAIFKRITSYFDSGWRAGREAREREESAL